jgi:disulfide bond formation protein DsbB
MTLAVSDPSLHQAYRAGALALMVVCAAILGALGIEHIGNIPPCHLCLQQRYAYYAGIPLLFGALVLLSAGEARWAAALFLFVSLLFFANAALGVYHAGAEWAFWPGPDSCTGTQSVTASAGDLLSSLETSIVVPCDKAALRILGVSLAGWNAVVSLFVFGLCLRAGADSLHRE